MFTEELLFFFNWVISSSVKHPLKKENCVFVTLNGITKILIQEWKQKNVSKIPKGEEVASTFNMSTLHQVQWNTIKNITFLMK